MKAILEFRFVTGHGFSRAETEIGFVTEHDFSSAEGEIGFVTGHDFSRAESRNKMNRALAPEGTTVQQPCF